jgi:hypothetical protein
MWQAVFHIEKEVAGYDAQGNEKQDHGDQQGGNPGDGDAPGFREF